MGETALNIDRLREEVARLGPWHHDVEVVPGLRTSEIPLSHDRTDGRRPTFYRPEAQIQRLVKDLFGKTMAGRSFLDCACNGGGHSLIAARMGAGRCFGFDARQEWVSQARFLAGFAPHSDLSFEQMQIKDLAGRDLGQFDVALFSGIFYHLPDPVNALKLVADRSREFIVVNTAARLLPGDMLTLERESATEPMSGVDGLAWLPSGPDVLRKILAWSGFPETRLHWSTKTASGWSRLQLIAARDARSFAHFDRVRPDRSGSGAGPILGIAKYLLHRLKSSGASA
jgi:SAM-dependent methyltransferase